MKRLSYFALSTTLLTALPLIPLLHGCSGGSSGSRDFEGANRIKLTLNQSNGSNFGNTLAELKKGDVGSSISPEVISVDASRTVYEGNSSNITKLMSFSIVFKQPVTLAAGTRFQIDGENPAATVQIGYDKGPLIIPPDTYAKVWGGFGRASGELTVESNTGGVIKIRLRNVVLSPKGPTTENSARGTLTFNGTFQSVISEDVE